MTKQGHIIVADIIVSQIQLGHIKKNAIKKSIIVASNFLTRDNYNFNHETFKNYIMERI